MAESNQVLSASSSSLRSFIATSNKGEEGKKTLSNLDLLLLLAQEMGSALPAMQEALHDKDIDIATNKTSLEKNEEIAPEFVKSNEMTFKEAADLYLQVVKLKKEATAKQGNVPLMASSGGAPTPPAPIIPPTPAFNANLQNELSDDDSYMHVGALFGKIEEAMAIYNAHTQSKGGVASNGSSKQEESSEELLKASIINMCNAICAQLMNIMQGMAANQKSMSAQGEALLNAAKAELQTIIDDVQKLEEAEANSKKYGLIGEIIGAIIAAIMAVMAMVTLQPELLLVAAIALAYAIPGGGSALNKAIADSLVKDGCGQDVANIITGVIITVIVTLCTMGAGSLAVATESATAEGGEAAAEGGDIEMQQLAQNAANAAEDEIEAGEGVAEKPQESEKVKIPSKSSQYLKLARFGLGSGAMFGNLIPSILAKVLPGDDSKAWFAVIEIMATLLCAVLGGAGNSAGSLAGAVDDGASGVRATVLNAVRRLSNALKELGTKITDCVPSLNNISSLTTGKVLNVILKIARAFQAVALYEMSQAAGNQADIYGKQAPADSHIVLLNYLMSIDNQELKVYQDASSSQMQNLEQSLATTGNVLRGFEAGVQAMMA